MAREVNGYVIYPDSVGKMKLSAAKRYAKAASRRESDEYRVEGVDSGRVYARYRDGVLVSTNSARRQNPASSARKVKMRRVPKGWIKAKAVRVVNRGGRRIVEVRR